MRPYDHYDVLIRPNYEAAAALGWGAAIGSLAVANHMTQLPDDPFLWAGGLCALMAVSRGIQAVGRFTRMSRLYGKKLKFIRLDRLLKKVKPNEIWLGSGFVWEREHTQAAHELSRLDEMSHFNRRTEMGASWIHGLHRGREQPVHLPLKGAEGHLLIVGTTGSGKTRLFDLLITQAIARGEGVLIVDPKGDKELCENARRACAAMGHPEKFAYFHPGFPENSVRINPLHNYSRPTSLASRIAALVPSETGADPFKAFAQMALNNVIQGLLIAGQAPTLVRIRSYLEGGVDDLLIRAISAFASKVLHDWETASHPFVSQAKSMEARAQGMIFFYNQRVRGVEANPDLEGLIAMWQHDRQHFSKMIASLLPVMNMLTSGSLGPLLSPTREDGAVYTDMASLIDEGKVVYIGLDSLSDQMVGAAIGSIILADLAAVAGARYNYGEDLAAVNVFVDEAAEVINDPFIQILNKGRGAKIRLTLATQTYADFEARTGSDAKARQVLGNVNNTIYLRTLDTKSQQECADGQPKVQIRSLQLTQALSTGANDPLSHGGSSGERMGETPVELIDPTLLGRLPNLEFFASLQGGRYYKGRLPILTEKPQK